MAKIRLENHTEGIGYVPGGMRFDAYYCPVVDNMDNPIGGAKITFEDDGLWAEIHIDKWPPFCGCYPTIEVDNMNDLSKDGTVINKGKIISLRLEPIWHKEQS